MNEVTSSESLGDVIHNVDQLNPLTVGLACCCCSSSCSAAVLVSETDIVK